MAKKKNKTPRVSQSDVDVVKALYEAGYKTSKIVEVTGRGVQTVIHLRRAKDFADYQRISREYNEASRARIAAKEAAAEAALKQPEPVETDSSIRDHLPKDGAEYKPQTEFQKVFISQTNAIIAKLSAIEFKLDVK